MLAWVKRLAPLIGIQLGLLVLLLAFYAPDRQSFVAACLDKHRLAQTTRVPRLLLVGGSATAFGTDSALLAKELGRPVVNLGGQGSQGLAYRLREAAALMHADDMVVLSIEYPYLLDTPPLGLTLWRTIEACRACSSFIDAAGWREVLDGGLHYLRHVTHRTALRLASGRWPADAAPYSRGSFNAFGDVVGHHGRAGPGPIDAPVALEATQRALDRSLAQLNAFAKLCRERRVSVWFFYPAYSREHYRRSAPAIERIHRHLATRLLLPLLNTPAEMALEPGAFFNTSYHLNAAAARARTSLLASRLTQVVACGSAACGRPQPASVGPGHPATPLAAAPR